MLQAERGDRQNAETVLVDEEGIFVGSVRRAAVLHNTHAASGHLIDDAMVEQDHTVGDVLFKASSGKSTVATLAGNNRRDTFFFEPAEETA
jgi:hypothetical protein